MNQNTLPPWPTKAIVEVSLVRVQSALPFFMPSVFEDMPKRHLYSANMDVLSFSEILPGSNSSANRHISCRVLLWTPSAPARISPSYDEPSLQCTTTLSSEWSTLQIFFLSRILLLSTMWL